ncbi:hypothetical protein GGS20DRAFT_364367 [Poronia punctata]|nr:hypothetical protein GGS20DRAFT_364367 [Poronia punctata]
MLPPIDDDVLRDNPKFAALYKTITTEILNPDVSTRDAIDPTSKQRNGVREELKAHRLKAARFSLLRNAISTATSDVNPAVPEAPPPKQPQSKLQQPQHHRRSKSRPQQIQTQPKGHSRSQSQSQIQTQSTTPALPPDLIHLLTLIPPFLNNASTLSPSSLTLLLCNPPFTSLPVHFPLLLTLISSRLTTQAKSLARVLNPNTNSSYIHRTIPSLSAVTTSLITTLQTTQTTLSKTRLTTLSTLTNHHRLQTETLTLLVRALETKHGAISTSSELNAISASQEAETLRLASEALLWDTLHHLYPPEARAALANYRQHLLDAGRRLDDGARVREAELADYGVAVSVESEALDKSDRRASYQEYISGNRLRARERSKTVGDENKERTMREMARVWREMETRLREIQGDLNRLR